MIEIVLAKNTVLDNQISCDNTDMNIIIIGTSSYYKKRKDTKHSAMIRKWLVYIFL